MTPKVAAIPMPAATVVLIDPREPLTTFVMRRARTMAFAPGMHVFPGGRLAGADFAEVPWQPSVGFDPDDQARRLSADADLARALTVCAVRETFEETGVLLARGGDGRMPRWDEDAAGREAARDQLMSGRTSLADILASRDLVLDPALLPPWDHWVTPVTQPMRFDTRFFLAVLPEGQSARDVSGEADEVAWLEPARALEAHARGEIDLLPPTRSVLGDLADHGSAPALLAAAPQRRITPILTDQRT